MKACRALLIAAGLALAPGAALAQFDVADRVSEEETVSLIADSVTYDSETEVVIAEGNVEVYYGDRTLTAARIVYDEKTERITADGPLTLRDAGEVTVFASAADLDAELRDGLVRGAQLVVGTQGKLAAVEAQRHEGRFNALSRAVYSPCEVCSDEPTPLWRLRANRVIHDEETKIIHYESATFDVLGVPVMWFPYFQHPDPTVKRATGFLAPRFLNDTDLGQAIKVPFHVVIDDQSDFTITPFLTTEAGQVYELEYRHAFEDGTVTLFGSVTPEVLDETETPGFRGHVDSHARFNLPYGFDWGLDLLFASDDEYLDFYNFSTEDRLTSEMFVNRYRRSGFVDVSGIYFQSLVRRELSGQIPLVLPTVDLRHNLDDPYLDGEFGIFSSSNTLFRDNGQDSSRITVGADWERRAITDQGVALRAFAETRVDSFFTRDTDSDDATVRFRPQMGVEARYPLLLDLENDAAHVLEPMAQAILAPTGGNGDAVPNEDSIIAEFDETNILDDNHHSGLDLFEDGPRLNLGLSYSRTAAEDGLILDAVVGRVFRLQDNNAFSVGSGLANAESDYIAALTTGWDPYVKVSSRFRLDEDYEFTRLELDGQIDVAPVLLRTEYSFFKEDPDIDLPIQRQEIRGVVAVNVTPEWTLGATASRNLEQNESVDAIGRVTFRNECCLIRAFVRREFSEVTDEDTETTFGIEIDLLGGETRPTNPENRRTTLIDLF